MKRMNAKVFGLILLAAVLPASRLCAQQDAQFSHFYANRLFFNPAGMSDDNLLHAGLTDREQYLGSGIQACGFRMVNGTYFFSDQNMGAGFTAYQWNANIETNLIIKGSYMYRLQVGYDAYVNFGLNAGMIHRFLRQGYRADGEEFIPTPDDKFNPNLDMGLGVEFHTTNILAGVSVQHLPIRLGANPAREVLHSYYYFGYNFFLDEEWSVFPLLVLRMGERCTNLDMNIRAMYRDLVNFGISYRLDALVFMAGLNIDKNFAVGYAFDINIGSTNRVYMPSHELVLTYRCAFKNPDRPLVKFE